MYEIFLHSINIQSVVAGVVVGMSTAVGGLIGLYLARGMRRRGGTTVSGGMPVSGEQQPELHMHTEHPPARIQNDTDDRHETSTPLYAGEKRRKTAQRRTKKIIVR